MIHIACNIDANFIQHCAVTLVSLFENNKRADICVHIVAPYLSEADQAILRNLATPYGNEVCFYYPPKDLLQCFSIKKFGKRISMATYYRCMFHFKGTKTLSLHRTTFSKSWSLNWMRSG